MKTSKALIVHIIQYHMTFNSVWVLMFIVLQEARKISVKVMDLEETATHTGELNITQS